MMETFPLTNTYVFAYGSLINPSSRSRTLHHPISQDSLPCFIRGYTRGWNYCAKDYTAVGISKLDNIIRHRKQWPATVNGVLIPLASDEDLVELDKRERDYKRFVVDPEDISITGVSTTVASEMEEWLKLPQVTVWTYVVPVRHESCVWSHRPCPKTPISQQYLDIIIDGCLRICESCSWSCVSNDSDSDSSYSSVGTGSSSPSSSSSSCTHSANEEDCFARLFLETTVGWGPVRNDRKNMVKFDEWLDIDLLEVDTLLRALSADDRRNCYE